MAAFALLAVPVAAAAMPAASHGPGAIQRQHAALPPELLFVPTGNEAIQIYNLQNPKSGPLAEITSALVGTQFQMTADSANDLFVVNDNFLNENQEYVSVYPPPYDGTPALLTGVEFPIGVAVAASGTVYVSNCGAYCGQTATVYVYQNGSTTPTATITSAAFSSLGGLAVDAAGNLYIADADRDTGATTIFEVPNGSMTPQPVAMDGLFNFGGPGVPSVAIDRAGGLVIGNNSNSTYTLEFKPHAKVATRVIDQFDFFDTPGIENYGPDGKIYVPINCADQSCEGAVLGFGPKGEKPAVIVGAPGQVSGVATAPNPVFGGLRTRTPVAYLHPRALSASRVVAQQQVRHGAAPPPARVVTPLSLFARTRTGATGRGGGWLSPAAKRGDHIMYVASAPASSGFVNLYSTQGQTQAPIGMIADGISQPWGIDTDAHGSLYVANNGNNTVTKYAPGSTSPSATYTQGIGTPYDVKIGRDGTLYVANATGAPSGAGSVTEYAPGSTMPKLTITNAGLYAFAVGIDKKNNLYVCWYDLSATREYIYEYAPGSSSGTPLNLDLPAPSFPAFSLAFDHAGNLVTWYESYDHSVKYLATFPPGATEPSRKEQGGSLLTIVSGITFPRMGGGVYLSSANTNEADKLVYGRLVPLDMILLDDATGNALSPGS
jgi:sugar lactone lactonase YvrE